MSLLDAFTFEAYRDPRDIWIAVRSDGAVGSGTVDDPFDGGSRAGPLLGATLALDRKDVVFTTEQAHPFSNNQTVAIFGVSGSGADVFNGNFSITNLSNKSFRITLPGSPPASPSPAPGLADNIRSGILGNSVSATLSHGTLVEFMEVTVAATQSYTNGDTVQIAGATGSGAAWFNGTFAIYAVTASQFKYRLTRVNVPSGGASGQSVTSTKLAPVQVRLSWPAVTVTTAPNHDYLTDEIVRISGAGSAVFNGEFPIHGPSNGNLFYYRLPSDPGSDAAHTNLTCYRVVYRFDEIMRVLPKNSRVRLAPGVFETRGHYVFRDDYNPSSPTRVINWLLKAGQRITGSGIGQTTVRLMYGNSGGQVTVAFGTNQIGPDPDTRTVNDLEISELSIDCNTRQQVAEPVAKAGIRHSGSHARIHNVRVFDYGTHVDTVECFVIALASAHPSFPDPVDCRIKDCITEQPSPNGTFTDTCLHFLAGEEPNGGVMGWHRACAIRNNFVDNSHADNPVRIATISFVGSVATITTVRPHNRSASNGDWVVISGAQVAGSLNNPINGSFAVASVPSSMVFTVNLPGTPAALPTGEMWVDRFTGHRVSVHELRRDTVDVTGLTVVVTTHTPHNRKPGQWIAMFGSADPIPAGAEPYYGRFPIVAIDSPTALKYRTNAVPRINLTDDVSPPAGYARDGVFLGHGSIGLSTDGGSEAVTEGNFIFSTAAGGSYHDTWGTKDQTDRENYYSDILSGPYNNMGGSSELKLGSLNVVGNVATMTTFLVHGLVTGQAVRIASTSAGTLTAYYLITSVGPNSFTFDTNGQPPPGNYFGALWQVGLAIKERNATDLGTGHHIGTFWGFSGGVRFYSPAHGNHYAFRQVIVRHNLITLSEFGSNPLAKGIELQNVDNGLIANNLIDLENDAPVELSGTNNRIEFFNNQGPNGQLARRIGGNPNSELTEQVQDVLLLSI